jgi:membrane-associated protein
MDFMQFFDMLLHVDKTLEVLIQQYGTLIYAVLFAIIFCRDRPGGPVLLPWRHPAVHCRRPVRGRRNESAAADVPADHGGHHRQHRQLLDRREMGQRVFTHDYRWLNKEALRRTHEFFEKHGGTT